MWIVRLALRRPYTFVVLSLMLLLLAPIVVTRTPTDIFPNIDIPVVSVIWQYTGLSAQEMANRIVYYSERMTTTTVNNIEHIESQSLNGVAVIKVFLQPGANVEGAISEVIAESQVGLKQFPPGTTPPHSCTSTNFSPFNGRGGLYRDDAAVHPNTEPAIDFTALSVLAFAQEAAS